MLIWFKSALGNGISTDQARRCDLKFILEHRKHLILLRTVMTENVAVPTDLLPCLHCKERSCLPCFWLLLSKSSYVPAHAAYQSPRNDLLYNTVFQGLQLPNTADTWLFQFWCQHTGEHADGGTDLFWPQRGIRLASANCDAHPPDRW